MLGLLILNFYPIFDTIYQSFFKTGDFGLGNVFISIKNYQDMLFGSGKAELWQSLWNTIKYAIIEVPFSVVISITLAVFLNRKMKAVRYTVRSSSCLWSVLRQP